MIKSMVPKLRRRIGDDVEPYAFPDERLEGFIQDAVDHLETGMYKKGRRVMGDSIVDSEGNAVILSGSEQAIYVIQAAILFTKATKSRADRDNFALRKPNLSVDTSGQSSDHEKTIAILEDELRKTITSLAIMNIGGYRVEP